MADAECRVTCLPRKRVMQHSTFVNPPRRIGFDDLRRLRHSQRGRMANERVNMIRGAIHIDGYAFQPSDDAADIREDVITTVLANVRQSTFCAEDDVSDQVCIGMPMRKSPETREGQSHHISRL